MGKINNEIKKIIHDEHLGFVATASKDGLPNVSPKGSIRVWDDDTLLFIDFMSLKTRQNLLENPHIAIGIISFQDFVAYQIKGTAEVLKDGFVHDKISAELRKLDPAYDSQIYVVKIKVEEAHRQTAPAIIDKLCRL